MPGESPKYSTTELSFLKGNTRIMLTEWIPFGLNNIIFFSDKLEAGEEASPTLLTESIDYQPEESTFQTSSDISRVRVVDAVRTQFVEFITDVLFKETGGDIQKEEIGVHVDVSGRVTYGIELKETLGQSEKHSFDSLSRVVADLVVDTSKVMDTVLNNYQKSLLGLVYAGVSHQREKFVVITADENEPCFNDIRMYMERPELNSEVNQVIVEATDAFNLSDETRVIFGTHGVIFITHNPDRYKHALTLYSLLNSIRTFQSNVFARMEMAIDNMDHLRTMISENAYESVSRLLEEITTLSENLVMFETIFSFIEEALNGIDAQLKNQVNLNEHEKEFLSHTNNEFMLETLKARVKDAHYILDGLEKEITYLEQLSTTLNEKEMKNLFGALRENTAHSVAIGEALEVLEAGIFGVYVLEFLNIAMETSGGFDEDPAGGMLILPLSFWIVVLGGLSGVYAGWRLIQWMKKKALDRFRRGVD